MACKKKKNLNMAFMLLNRYLDIYEVIDDPDNNNLGDNEGFDVTDIPSPFDVSFQLYNNRFLYQKII
jgi:intraflagellar transport protein 172